MSDQNEFDPRLAALFEQERASVPADAFVASTMRKIRAERRRTDFMRVGLRVVALAGLVVASPWLIAGGARLNAALQSSLSWTMEQPSVWGLGALAVLAALATRVRSW